MADGFLNVEIDRIRLSGLDLTPERAARMRILVERELGRLLAREGFGEGLTTGEVSRVRAPALSVNPGHGESQFAGGLARSIAQSLSGSK